MSNSIRNEYRLSFISETLDDIFYNRINVFYFLGKIDPWPTESSPPPVPINSLQNDLAIRDEIVYMRRIRGRDVSLVVPNYTWESGQVYQPWDHTLNLRDVPFYVTVKTTVAQVDQVRVYKCLDNNGGVPSTEAPSGTTPGGIIQTSDGYKWIYMYDVPTLKQRKFLSRGFVPVQRALSDSFYNRGAIERVTVDEQGSGYNAANPPSITISGDGSGAVLTPVISSDPVDPGKLVSVTVTNPGSNYTFATLSVTGGAPGGSGAQIVAEIKESDFSSDQDDVEQAAVNTKGRIYCIKVSAGGTNYTSTPTVTIEGDGTGATATATVVNNQVQKINVTNYGSGYTYATVTIAEGGANATGATAYAVIPPPNGHGFDAVRELYGDTLCLYSLIQDDATLNNLGQQFRQYGLIINPTARTTNRRITTDRHFATIDVTLNDTTNLLVDDLLTTAPGGKKHRVAAINGNTVKLIQQTPDYVSLTSATLVKGNNTYTYTVTNVNSEPIVNKYSGYLLTVSNEVAFTPDSSSAIATRTFLKI